MKNLKNSLRYSLYLVLVVGGIIIGNLTKKPNVIIEEKEVIIPWNDMCHKRNFDGLYATVVYEDAKSYMKDQKYRIRKPVQVYAYDSIFLDTIYYIEYDRKRWVDTCLMRELR